MGYIKVKLFLIVAVTAINVNAQSSVDILSYISKYKQIALEQEKLYGIPASIILAQGILESGAGRSKLTCNANNHFGIKAYGGWKGPVFLAWDDERQKSRFRKYASAKESYKDHSLFLKNNNRYRKLFTLSVYDYRGWAIELQKAGYATAGNYAKALIGFIDAYKLYSLNGGVKLKAGKTVTIIKYITTEVPTFDSECVLGDAEESDEEKSIERIVKRFVVDINGVRCTILYPGETLASISQRYDIPQSKILEYNEVSNGKHFKDGDIIYLQKKKKKFSGLQDFYSIKEGETLYDVAQMFGIRMASLAKMNDKDFFSILREGEKLRLK
jgi:hypothetical protein